MTFFFYKDLKMVSQCQSYTPDFVLFVKKFENLFNATATKVEAEGRFSSVVTQKAVTFCHPLQTLQKPRHYLCLLRPF